MINLVEINQANEAQAKALYESSFPDNERKPWHIMVACVKKKSMKMYVMMKDDQVIALAFIVLYYPYLLLDYLAIDKIFQNQGIGSQILKWLIEKYPEHALFVEIEDYDVYQEAIMLKRKNFYLKNGLQVMPFHMILFNVYMQILCTKTITFDDYRNLLIQVFGPYCEKNVLLNRQFD